MTAPILRFPVFSKPCWAAAALMPPKCRNGLTRTHFKKNAIGTFGDTGKNILRGPRYFDADLAAVKNAKITERVSMEFRAEFFNAFNNVNFGRPDGNLADLGTTFGEITGMAGSSSSNTYGTAQPRIIQFAVKFSF